MSLGTLGASRCNPHFGRLETIGNLEMVETHGQSIGKKWKNIIELASWECVSIFFGVTIITMLLYEPSTV